MRNKKLFYLIMILVVVMTSSVSFGRRSNIISEVSGSRTASQKLQWIQQRQEHNAYVAALREAQERRRTSINEMRRQDYLKEMTLRDAIAKDRARKLKLGY